MLKQFANIAGAMAKGWAAYRLYLVLMGFGVTLIGGGGVWQYLVTTYIERQQDEQGQQRDNDDQAPWWMAYAVGGVFILAGGVPMYRRHQKDAVTHDAQRFPSVHVTHDSEYHYILDGTRNDDMPKTTWSFTFDVQAGNQGCVITAVKGYRYAAGLCMPSVVELHHIGEGKVLKTHEKDGYNLALKEPLQLSAFKTARLLVKTSSPSPPAAKMSVGELEDGDYSMAVEYRIAGTQEVGNQSFIKGYDHVTKKLLDVETVRTPIYLNNQVVDEALAGNVISQKDADFLKSHSESLLDIYWRNRPLDGSQPFSCDKKRIIELGYVIRQAERG